ncbi:uncharacterized protein LOC129729408 [Wyeomyia smithii]|uniref:uncharacterized protein LOC129729408 n=1 Tax=Wyeomyia smithii TaxID=174621 RepID=UPI002467CD39|nr:uncharacterized protein LOC129729408 [Wyeomyia smithii]
MAPRSNIWLYFVKGDLKGECKQCGAIIKTAGNTMNMWNHLKRRHPREYAIAQGTIWDDPSSVVEEVVTSEQLLTEEQYEQELRKEAQQALDQLAESEVIIEEHESSAKQTPMRMKTAGKRRYQSLPHSSPAKTPRMQNSSYVSASNFSEHKNVANVLANFQQTVQSLQKVDSYQVFGNFIAEELRKIPEEKLANQVQRKLTRFLMDCIDEADRPAENSSHSKNEF